MHVVVLQRGRVFRHVTMARKVLVCNSCSRLRMALSLVRRGKESWGLKPMDSG